MESRERPGKSGREAGERGGVRRGGGGGQEGGRGCKFTRMFAFMIF